MKRLFETVVLRTAGSIAALGLLAMALVVTGDVVLRGFGIALVGSVEVTGILLAMLVFAGVAFAQASDGHVTMDAFVNAMPTIYRRWARIVSLFLCAAICGLLTWGAASEAYDSYVAREFQFGTMHFPLWPTKAVVALGLGLLAIELLLQAVAALGARRDGDETEGR